MGYILPIHFDQYQQYHNRIKGIQSNFFRTVQIEKVKQTYLFHFDSTTKRNIQEYVKKQSVYQKKRADTIYSELTGVGKLFNKTI